MARQRSIFSLILVLLATFLISCGGPNVAAPPPTYTTAQLQKIQTYLPEIKTVRDRADELRDLIEKKDWIFVSNFIHGPITEAKLSMSYITPNLLPNVQPAARQVTKDFFNHLIKIDKAAKDSNSLVALNNYQAVFDDIDKFLELVPDPSTATEKS